MLIGGHQPRLYDVLQVSPKAGADVIQAAYRALARAYHPDVSNIPDAARLMRELNAAYAVLSDPGRRAQYDAERARSTRVRLGKRRDGKHRAGRVDGTVRTAGGRPSARTASAAGRALVVTSFVALVLILTLAVWALFDPVDDEMAGARRPRTGLPEITNGVRGHFPLAAPTNNPRNRSSALCEPWQPGFGTSC